LTTLFFRIAVMTLSSTVFLSLMSASIATAHLPGQPIVQQTARPSAQPSARPSAQPLGAPATVSDQARTLVAETGTQTPVEPAVSCLPDSTIVVLAITEPLKSGRAKKGQQVEFEVVEDVSVDGAVLIAKGSKAVGTVTASSGRSIFAISGKLAVTIDAVTAIDGTQIPLRGGESLKGDGRVATMLTTVLAVGGGYLPAAPLFFLLPGKDAKIAKRATFTGFVQGDVAVQVAR
jgi:hypothetical protein